uniref:Uncharacterized protein n=1 Tax=Knipowitschia caucasica TaxID=637954 RepID=A0AAV2LFJ6_KNICA
MQSSTTVRAPASPDDSAPDSPSILLHNISPMAPSPRKSVRLASRDPGSVRAYLAARGVVPGPDATSLQLQSLFDQLSAGSTSPLRDLVPPPRKRQSKTKHTQAKRACLPRPPLAASSRGFRAFPWILGLFCCGLPGSSTRS